MAAGHSTMLRRQWMKACLMTALFPDLIFDKAFAGQSKPDAPDAIVDPHSGATASQPVYATLTEALQAAPAASAKPFRVLIGQGRFHEKLVIDKPNIMLIGAGIDATILSFDAFAGGEKPGGGHWGTNGSATVTVRAPGFAAHKLTIRNDFDFLDNDRRDPSASDRIGASQAVALMLDQGADRSLFDQVALIGYQDTLYADAGISLFTRCRIAGNVDFIFGAGTALFSDCDIVSRRRGMASIRPAGFVTAPSTKLEDPYGLIFHGCRLIREDGTIPKASHYLGRPWHPTRTFADGRYADPNAVGQSLFIDCEMDDHIDSRGWTEMTGLAKDGSRRSFSPLKEARFFEYRSHGPGAAINPDRPQLSHEEASRFSPDKVLGDWFAALHQGQ
ncbi:pectinesterase family protein [Allorhizobium sp. BGMRC 0089]|uniref:pectinesterase family protein n=1 Tax=Allorhizobium sonneratiae TaxID=2934936 RepID=UPI00203463E6|nr:pectinesterase family protein [Allorhizobium sonneratiae]MCM2293644.1 pectinesterase family protein [Allorhizobium sonneratiae]